MKNQLVYMINQSLTISKYLDGILNKRFNEERINIEKSLMLFIWFLEYGQ